METKIVQRIGVLSAGKITGVMYTFIGLIVGAMFSLFSLIGAAAGMASGEDEAALGLLFGVGAIVIAPIFYGTLGFIGGLIGAAIYNFVAKLIGGLELELQ